MIHAEPRTPRERRHDHNHRRILETAMAMVEEGGFGALSVNKLAEAVDYTPGALYRYFGSKDALLAQLLAQILDEVRRDLESALARLPERTSPLGRVVALAHGYRAFARREPHRFGLLAMSLAEPRVLLGEPASARPVVAGILAALEPLAAALRQAAEAGLLDQGDEAERAICVFALLQGLLPLRKRSATVPKLLDVDWLATRGVRALLLGFGAKARAVDAAMGIS